MPRPLVGGNGVSSARGVRTVRTGEVCPSGRPFDQRLARH